MLFNILLDDQLNKIYKRTKLRIKNSIGKLV